jgi:hypothetical protein
MTDGRTQPTIPLSAIERPLCAKCQCRMMLARISPAGHGLEMQMFECAKCDRAETKMVAADPLQSAQGWLSGELRPPR